MKYKRITDKLVEIEYDKDENAEVLDCTKEIETYIKKILPEENED